MQLYYTPLSHFSRKVRVLLAAWDVECALIDAGNVADADVGAFGGSPIRQVPVLRDGAVTLVDSERIAAWLAARHDPADALRVRSLEPRQLALRGVLDGVMNAEVRWVLGGRTGIERTGLRFFEKARQAVDGGLDWLEAHAAWFDTEAPGFAEAHLACALDHLAWYRLLEPASRPALEAVRAHVSAQPWIAASAPDRVPGAVRPSIG